MITVLRTVRGAHKVTEGSVNRGGKSVRGCTGMCAHALRALAEKLLDMMPVRMEKMTMPMNIQSVPRILPSGVIGTLSP